MDTRIIKIVNQTDENIRIGRTVYPANLWPAKLIFQDQPGAWVMGDERIEYTGRRPTHIMNLQPPRGGILYILPRDAAEWLSERGLRCDIAFVREIGRLDDGTLDAEVIRPLHHALYWLA